MRNGQYCRKQYKLRLWYFSYAEGGLESMVKRVLLMIALAVVAFSIIGCKTVQGIGGDITWLGKKGEQVVER